MEASSSTSAEASKELRSVPISSTYFHLRALRSMNFDVAVLLLLASMRFHVHSMKGKQIETCTEVNCRLPWKEANWRLQRKEAETAGTSIAAPEASNELYLLPLLVPGYIYVFSADFNEICCSLTC